MRHFGIDIETTGLRPSVHRITSVALVECEWHLDATLFETHMEFQLPDYREEAEQLGVRVADNRRTMEWRDEHPELFAYERGLEVISPQDLCYGIDDFFDQMADDYRVWAWHTEFDLAFLVHLNTIFGSPASLWDHRAPCDAPSYIRGCGEKPAELKRLAKTTKFGRSLIEHRAVDDVMLMFLAVALAEQARAARAEGGRHHDDGPVDPEMDFSPI